MPPPARLPVIVLTGFLGSGKTTLLNHLLRQWPDSAVLINEFGAMPVDQRLLEQHNIPVSVLAGGCLCCQLRDALAPTLKNLWMAWNGQTPKPFNRLIIESSGVASPEPVLDVLLRDSWLARRLSLQAVVTTLAAPSAAAQLDRFPEAMAQAAWADVLVLTHTDLADAASLELLASKLAGIAPDTPRLNACFGQIEAEDWLASVPSALRRVPTGTALPDHGFHDLALRLDAPIPWPRLDRILRDLIKRYSARLVRIKGVIHLPDELRPWVVQFTQGRLSPPVALNPGPADDGTGRLIFITDGKIEGLAEDLMEAIRNSGKSKALELG